MKKLKMVLSTFFLIGLLAYFCFSMKVDSIKKDFLLTAQNAYEEHNMSRVNVEIKGDNFKTMRKLILTGVVLNEELKEKAYLIALSIEGVAEVENNLQIKKIDKDFDLKNFKVKNRKIKL